MAGSGTGAGWGVKTVLLPELVAGPFKLCVSVGVVQKPPDVVSMTVELEVFVPDELVPESVDWVSIGLVDSVEVVSASVDAEF